MPSSQMPAIDVMDLRDKVGALTFARGQAYFREGMVDRRAVRYEPEDMRLSGKVRGRRPLPYECQVWLEPGPTQKGSRFDGGICSCPMGRACKHIVAVALSANFAAAANRAKGGGEAWEDPVRRLTQTVARHSAMRRLEPVGLQFKYTAPGGHREAGGTLQVRAVRRGQRGAWVAHQGLRLGSTMYNPDGVSRAQERWFGALADLSWRRGATNGWLDLSQVRSDYLWPLLGRAAELGIALAGEKEADSVALANLVELRIDVRRAGDRVRLSATVDVGDQPLPNRYYLLTVGETGFAVVSEATGPRTIILGPGTGQPREIEAAVLRLLPLTLPAADLPRFMSAYFPPLARSIAIASGDGSVAIPETPGPSLVLTITPGEGMRAALRWRWRYGAGPDKQEFAPDAVLPPFAAQVEPGLWNAEDALFQRLTASRDWPQSATDVLRDQIALRRRMAPQGISLDANRVHAAPAEAGADGDRAEPGLIRDPAAEGAILDQVEAVRRQTPAFAGPQAGEETLEGMAIVRFGVAPLPRLRQIEAVRVEGELPATEEILDEPEISLTAESSEDGDWFDLSGLVKVGGKRIAFRELFEALAAGETYLLLPDGSLIPLDRPAFQKLAALIAEARGLSEAKGKPRLGRYHASLLGELEDVADVQGAEAWRSSMAKLRELAAGEQAPQAEPLPEGLLGELRPYQRTGYDWLMFVWRHHLGGILADDMGLGKTLQTLAMIAKARQEAGPESAPFLVVAPASVVPGWLEEAARFTPGLKVAAATATRAKDRVPMAALRDGADLVVTTYAVFRIDHEQFAAAPWAGLVLDEAQFAKNAASKANQLARKLKTPFKLAVTGTPMENSLDELWAITAIVAPGLLGSRTQFRELYGERARGAGERGGERMERLRRRVKPLLMRRTKELVAPELPERQEQVFHVKLEGRHRTLYDTYLQRERQRMLGLLEDYEANQFAIFRSLTTLRRAALDVTLVDPEAQGVPSSKLDVLMDQLEQVAAAGHRALVFSQFTTYLAKARERLDAAGVAYAYLDGQTKNRAEVIGGFKRGEAPVFLISLKAGGFGLNLTEADYVYLLDPWWNPATENQAIDRTHRIGQDRPVMVFRLVAEQTIEDKVMALKAKKQALFDSLLDQRGGFGSGMTAEDVRQLIQ